MLPAAADFRSALRALALSQTEASALWSVDRSVVSRMALGKTPLRGWTACLLAAWLAHPELLDEARRAAREAA